MRIHRSAAKIAAGSSRIVVCSSFDGMHLGHQRLLDEATNAGAELALVDEVPSGGLRLSSRRSCLEELARRRYAAVLLQTARGDLAAILRALAPRMLICLASETPQPLDGGLSVRHVTPVQLAGAPITSARLGDAVAAGALDAAASMLGRPYAVDGRVVHGHHRGATIGVPTANLRIGGLRLPPDGVYAVTARAVGLDAIGVANLGTNPTFGNQTRSLETHIFDFDGDIYGARLEIGFVERLRDERKFDGIDALVAQIRRDMEAARAAHLRR